MSQNITNLRRKFYNYVSSIKNNTFQKELGEKKPILLQKKFYYIQI